MNQGYSSSGRAGMNPGYGQPVQPMGMGGPHHPPFGPQGGMTQQPPQYPSQQVVNNQAQPQVVTVVQGGQTFGTQPVSITCQFCKQPVTTEVVKKCSCGACCLCCVTGLLIWLCIQCCRNKEINCWDAEHKCPNCQQILGNYQSC